MVIQVFWLYTRWGRVIVVGIMGFDSLWAGVRVHIIVNLHLVDGGFNGGLCVVGERKTNSFLVFPH